MNLASVMAMQPEVLILDEPTSQLDPLAAADFLNTVRRINLELGTTVIITEHRLEDILPAADRVLVLEDGSIAALDTPRAVGQQLWQAQHPMFAAVPTPVQVFYRTGSTGESPLTVREGRNWLHSTLPSPVKHPSPSPLIPVKTDSVALQVKDLWFRYERNSQDILRGTELSVPSGCMHAIVGGNGAGKSTFLKAICGICKPYRGSVQLFGKNTRGSNDYLAMLPQDPKSLFVKDTVWEDLQEMCKDPNQISQICDLCQIQHLKERHPYDLSGGEQQRVALAKVLLTKPRLLLLDEPTKGIDGFFKETLADILCKLKEQSVAILMVSHDVEFCAKYADLVSMFFDGQILTTHNPQTFFGGNSFYTTAANRMSRGLFQNAITVDDVVGLYSKNREDGV